MTDFGILVDGLGVFTTYLDGQFDRRWRTGPWTGGYLAISSHSNASPRLPHFDRIEARVGRGGTLVFSDDFTSLSGWTVGYEATDGSWSINPASHGHYNRSGGLIYRAMPAEATYFELQGIYFDNDDDLGWLQLLVNRGAINTPTDDQDPDDTGYRAFLEADTGLLRVLGAQLRSGFQAGTAALA